MTTAAFQLLLASSSSDETDTLTAALALRDAGIAVHWLHERQKRPIGKNWSERPVATADQLRATYQTGYNVGARLGEQSATPFGYLHCLDIDVRVTEVADEAWAALADLLPSIRREDLPEVQSGSGGESRHLYFFSERPFRSKRLWTSEGKFRDSDGKWHFEAEIELFGTGKQTVLAPSIHPSGQPYRWLREFDFDAFEQPVIPAATIASLGVVDAQTFGYESRPPLTFDRPGQMERELDAIPVSDLHYDDWIRLGQALHHQFGGSQEGYDLWLHHTKRSAKFEGEAQVREMRKSKWKSFGKYRGEPVTMATVRKWYLAIAKIAEAKRQAEWMGELDDLDTETGSDFDDLLTAAAPANDNDHDDEAVFSKGLDEAAADGVVARMNREHAVVMHSGRALIATEFRDGTINFGTAADLHVFYDNRRVAKTSARKGETEPVSRYWLRHSDRRTYGHGVVFSPGHDVEGALNLWRGWAVTPKPSSSCERFLDHVRHVVCRGDQAQTDYVFGWMAHLVQRPAEKPGVALVLRGGKGAGKDTVADYLSKMIGRRHAPTVSHDKHIVGNFNRRLEAALLFHVQEGTWAGNHQAESVLKYLVTSETIEIERKGIDSFSLSSFLRLFISSNADWVVPASADERRWAIFNVSDVRRGDEPYFRALRAEMDGDGPAALLAWLQAYDLSGFNVRAAPETAGLLDEKIASLRGIHKWWLDALSSGAFASRDGLGDDWQTASYTIACTYLRADYEAWSRTQKFEGNPLGERQFGAKLHELVPDLDKKRQGSSERTWAYVIPPLDACRSAFNGWIGGIVDWT